MKYLSGIFRFITALTGFLAIFFLTTTKWLTATFGKNITIDQILFHLVTPQSGVSLKIVMKIAVFFLVLIAGGGYGFFLFTKLIISPAFSFHCPVFS
ncbi:MAG: hypothetical protein NC211_06880 [Alistipes senegalensis]|nr:hypothetical protein [Alistipes senegalensis]